MSDLHAYRASDELATALRSFADEYGTCVDAVWRWDNENPGTKLVFLGGGFGPDPSLVGFSDSADEVPKGLSRNQQRDWLIPARGKAGDPWRQILESMKLPSEAAVYRRFEVPAWAQGDGNGRGGVYVSTTGFLDAYQHGVFVGNAYEFDKPGPHLTPVKLSEFYAAKEAAGR